MRDRLEMKKVAVSLRQLSKAYKATVDPRVFKYTPAEIEASAKLYDKLRKAGAPQELLNQFRQQHIGATLDGKTVEMITTPGFMSGQYRRMIEPYLSPSEVERALKDTEAQVARMREFARSGKKGKIGPVISMPGDQYEAVRTQLGVHSPGITSSGREAVHNTVGLHEAREIRALKRSRSRKMSGPASPTTFMSHVGPDPMLNDVIIANTLTGEGAKGARDVFMQMRTPELRELRSQLSGDARAEALIDKLLSGGRINRHGRKYLDRVHAERLSGLNKKAMYRPTLRVARAKKVADALLP